MKSDDCAAYAVDRSSFVAMDATDGAFDDVSEEVEVTIPVVSQCCVAGQKIRRVPHPGNSPLGHYP